MSRFFKFAEYYHAIDADGDPGRAEHADEEAETEASLDRQWELATIEVVQAQRAYAELEDRMGENDSVVAAAWLRLWRAQERQRQLASQLH